MLIVGIREIFSKLTFEIHPVVSYITFSFQAIDLVALGYRNFFEQVHLDHAIKTVKAVKNCTRNQK